MKITFLSPMPNMTGGQRVIAIYADKLLERGHDVTVVCPKRNHPSRMQRLKAKIKGKTPVIAPKTSHYDDMRARLVLIDRPQPLLDTDLPDADVLIATWWETAYVAAQMPPEKGRQLYFVQHHETHNPATRHLSSGSYRLPLQKITIAGWLTQEMAETYEDRTVTLVPNSVDRNLFHAPPREKQAQPTVGLMYSPTPFKATDVAIEAIRLAQARVPDLRVIAFSKDPPSPALVLPSDAQFHLLPAQNELRELYASCDAFLFSSRSEGFGLPVLEAMACRTPVVGTRTGCAPDAITHGVSGYLAEVDSADQLADGLVKTLTASPKHWSSMSDAAHAYVQTYDWDDAADLFEQALLSAK